MKPDSLIGWTTKTWNCWMGIHNCKCGPECGKCYVDGPNMGFGKRDPLADIYLTKTWELPYELERLTVGTNHAVRVFTCSLSDFFHAEVDGRRLDGEVWLPQHMIKRGGSNGALSYYHQYWRDAAWQVMRDTPHCIYQVLTKRPERIINHLPKDWPYPNVWLGTSVGCNLTVSKIDSLRKVPVHPEAVRFLSCEPLLEDISEKINLAGIGWLIVGGESGTDPEYLYDPSADWKSGLHDRNPAGRRTMKLEWARSLQRMAYQRDIPLYFKQITARTSGARTDALGKEDTHEYPDPPKGMVWMPEETFPPKTELVQVKTGESK